MTIVPIFQAQAKRFVGQFHRHNIASIGAVFCIGLQDEGKLVGVAMVGIPKARLLMDGVTLEVTRVAVKEGTKNANSMLYGACARAASALGYKRLVTYTLQTESGASLKASGWTADENLRVGDSDWIRKNRSSHPSRDLFGNERIPEGPKVRWWKNL
jgi:hypothetical protein